MSDILNKFLKSSVVTPIGESRWAKLTKPYEGKFGPEYTVDLVLAKDDYKSFLNSLKPVIDRAKEETKKKYKNVEVVLPGEEIVGLKGIEDRPGFYIVRFKAKAQYESKRTGDIITRTIPIRDAGGVNLLDKDVLIGNGSLIRIACTASPIIKGGEGSTRNTGYIKLSLGIDAAQVVRLVEYKPINSTNVKFDAITNIDGAYMAGQSRGVSEVDSTEDFLDDELPSNLAAKKSGEVLEVDEADFNF